MIIRTSGLSRVSPDILFWFENKGKRKCTACVNWIIACRLWYIVGRAFQQKNSRAMHRRNLASRYLSDLRWNARLLCQPSLLSYATTVGNSTAQDIHQDFLHLKDRPRSIGYFLYASTRLAALSTDNRLRLSAACQSWSIWRLHDPPSLLIFSLCKENHNCSDNFPSATASIALTRIRTFLCWQVISLTDANLLNPGRYPSFTLIGQAIGSVRLAFGALLKLRPQVGYWLWTELPTASCQDILSKKLLLVCKLRSMIYSWEGLLSW